MCCENKISEKHKKTLLIFYLGEHYERLNEPQLLKTYKNSHRRNKGIIDKKVG